MIVAGDFETHYSKDYSLSRMSEVDYILDPRFETIMLGLKIGDGPTVPYVGKQRVAAALAQVDWTRAAWLSHNTRFDGAILAWHYGIVPKLYLDTLSMARATTHWNIGKSSLKVVSDYLGLPPKGDEVTRAIGKRLLDFSPYELEAYKSYNVRDNENCREIFDIVRPCFSANELTLIDLVLRMFILPQVQLDTKMLTRYLSELQQEKLQILDRVAVTPDVFSSNVKFSELLENLGVEVPMKYSAKQDRLIPALAKNDRGFKELCQDSTQPMEVQAVLAARMAVKSTLEEARTTNLIRMSETDWPLHGTGWGAVPLKYSGARTHRFSGDSGVNWLNFRRGSSVKGALRAPPGYRVVHRDASQIEARMVAWLAGCTHLAQAFAQGRDVYCEFASTIYHRTITPADKLERFIGKTAILSLGYSASADRFRHMLFVGNGGVSVNVTPIDAYAIVQNYRYTFPEIPNLWSKCEGLLKQVVAYSGRPIKGHFSDAQLDPIEVGHDCLWLPSGLAISYPQIRITAGEQRLELVYDDPYGGTRKIYGAKCLENISQALARIVVTEIAVRIYNLTGYHPFLCTYDSLDYVVPEADAERMDATLEDEFSVVPEWAKGLPLASEGGWGMSLLDAEKGVNQ